jgi:hypothetical protein
VPSFELHVVLATTWSIVSTDHDVQPPGLERYGAAPAMHVQPHDVQGELKFLQGALNGDQAHIP